jgi:hypothetical protein
MATGTSVIALSSVTQNGLILSSASGFNQLHDFSFTGQGSMFQIGGVAITASGFGGDTFERILFSNVFTGIINSRISVVYDRLLMGCSNLCIQSTSANDSTIVNSDLNALSIPGATSAIGITLLGDAGGMRIKNNKFNAGGFGYAAGINVIHSISDADLLIEGNSIEGWTVDGIVIGTSGGATLANIIISGNEIAFFGGSTPRAIFFPNAGAGISDVIISGNALSSSFEGINLGTTTNYNVSGNIIANASTGIVGTSGSSGAMIGANVFPNTATQINVGAATFTAITTTQPTYP